MDALKLKNKKVWLSVTGYWAVEMKSGFIKKFNSEVEANASFEKEYLN